MSGLNSLQILVVDDNPHMRAIVCAILRGVGILSVREASDGADALDALRSVPMDIVICDLNMAPIDGLDFTRAVRTAHDSPAPFVPIILMTGHTERSRIVQARDAGVTEFLAKPISAKTLLQRLCAVIDRPRPFIRSSGYTGPCRRRAENVDYAGPWRRRSDEERQANAAAAPASAKEIAE